MELIELETFLAVAELASVSRAAERLHVTQPAVSKRIQSLERSLGVLLFDRIGKRVYPTPAGVALAPKAKEILATVVDTERALKSLDAAVAGRLAMATSHHVGLHRLAPVLKSFTARFPEAELDIDFEDSEAAHHLVRSGAVELAVVTLDPAGSELDYQPVWDDPLVFVTASDTAAGPLSLAALAERPVVLPGLATYTGRIVAEAFASRGLTLRPTMSTNYLETISMLVAAGLGWSVLPRSMLGEALTEVATEDLGLNRTLGLVTNPNRTASAAARAFAEVLLAHRDANQPIN